MPDPTRRPTADEIDRLSDAVRRDPGAPGFVQLGDAYLALGRPRDAIEVGSRGLRVDPENVEGRMMLSRAFAALHQWKEAQAELLKVVKADRHHREGFRLLGEVLMRRADFERALPVLQHAQNLDPADASILAMLKRAREGRPLDPPAPVPSAQLPASAPAAPAARPAPPPSRPAPAAVAPPRPAPAAPAPVRRPPPPPAPPPRAESMADDEPTNVAAQFGQDTDEHAGAGLREDATEPSVLIAPPPPLARMELERVVKAGPAAPQERPVRVTDGRDRDEEAAPRVEHHEPPPPEDPFAPLDYDEPSIRSRLPLSSKLTGPTAAVAPRSKRESAPPPVRSKRESAPPPQPSAVRPRVIAVDKPKDAASAPLRQSAAVGENYLNDLLTGGVLDVPNVRVPELSYDLKPDRRWGRSSRRMFIYLFVLLFLGTAGGGAWYFYAEQQRREDVARHLAEARRLLRLGSYEALVNGSKEAMAAVERDRGNPHAIAGLAEVSAVRLLLYGDIRAEEVDTAIGAAARRLDEAAATNELAVARVARALAVLDRVDEPIALFAETTTVLDAALVRHPDDKLLRWLQGMTHLAAGRRKDAQSAFERAGAGEDGLVAALVAQGDHLLDDGKFAEARAMYDRVLARAPGHPYAFIGRSLARSEQSAEAGEAMADLNVGLTGESGPEVAAWKSLALASAQYLLEDYDDFSTELGKAAGVDDPRFLARVALGRIAEGKVSDAARLRAAITWYSESPQLHPLVAVVDAELLLARGLPDAALSALVDVTGLRPHKVRGRALLDLGKPQAALDELDAALALAPADRDAQTWREAARRLVSKAERAAADEALDKLGRSAKSKVVRFAHGLALLGSGDAKDAKEARNKLELAVADLSPEGPNALAYRAHVELARLDLAAGELGPAETHLKAALAQNPGYLPAHGLMGRILVKLGDPAAALEHLIEVVEAKTATALEELAYAEAVIAAPGAGDAEKAAARDAVRRAHQLGGVPTDELARVALLVDPALATELKLPGAPPAPPKRGR